MPKQATSPPIRQVDTTHTAEAFAFDDMSSIHHSIIDMDEELYSEPARSQKSHMENHSAVISTGQYDGVSQQHQTVRRKNVFMIVTLLLFIGIVAAIGVAMVFAMQDKPIGGESVREADQVLAEEETNPNTIVFEEEESPVIETVSESGNVTAGIFDTVTMPTEGSSEYALGFEEIASETQTPTYKPTPSSTNCIPLELGIIFEGNANQTEWKVVKGADGSPDKEVVWQSTPYDAATYDSKAVTHRKCLPPQMYTFIFTDTDGARSYVLSSAGDVIVSGMSIDSKEDIVAFELPFEAPEPVDTDRDGVDDRLGTLMPYDSSGLVEGVDCEPFRLEIQTDDSGVETLWRLYEGADNSGEIVADGGPYASNSNYVFEYCLRSPSVYTFYIYDWASDGLCCMSGEGYYKLSSGENIIVDATEEFGSNGMNTFTLPIGMVTLPIGMAASDVSVTPSSAPSVTPKKQANDRPPKENNSLRAPSMTPTKPNTNPKNNN